MAADATNETSTKNGGNYMISKSDETTKLADSLDQYSVIPANTPNSDNTRETSDVSSNNKTDDSKSNDEKQAEMSSSTAYGGYGANPNLQSQADFSTKISSDKTAIEFDKLGIILNKDGSVSVVKNWDQLSDKQKNKLLERNRKRRNELEKQFGKPLSEIQKDLKKNNA